MFKLGCAVVIAGLLSGCAVDGLTLGRQAVDRGDYQTAMNHFAAEAQSGNPRAIYNLEIMSLAGAGAPADREQAIRLFTLAARMGLPAAQVELANLGAAVPQPDLVRRVTTEDFALIMLMQQRQQQQRPRQPAYRPPVQTNCYTDRMGNTNCTTY